MNRAQRRKAGLRVEKVRVNLAEWRATPDKPVTRGEALALLQLHRVNDHKAPWWRRLWRR